MQLLDAALGHGRRRSISLSFPVHLIIGIERVGFSSIARVRFKDSPTKGTGIRLHSTEVMGVLSGFKCPSLPRI